MKRIFLSIVMLVVANFIATASDESTSSGNTVSNQDGMAMAQGMVLEDSSRVHIAASVGVGFANVRMGNQQFDKKSVIHYQAGAVVDYMLAKRCFLESGLSFLHKGYKNSHQGNAGLDEETLHLYYLQIPVTFNYMIPVEKVWLIPQAGPYLSFALAGVYNKYSDIEGVQKDESHNIFKDENPNGTKKYRRFDCGVRFGVNVLFLKKVRVGIDYDLGLVNILNKNYYANDADVKSKNGVFSVNFAYYFK